jgi:hypothetical protein
MVVQTQRRLPGAHPLEMPVQLPVQLPVQPLPMVAKAPTLQRERTKRQTTKGNMIHHFFHYIAFI